MPEIEHYIALTEDQRQVIEQSLGDPWLVGQMPEIERIIAGKATPLEIVEIVKTCFRVGYLKGIGAVVEVHNRLAKENYKGKGVNNV